MPTKSEWNTITHPVTGVKHRLDSIQGKKILDKFLLYSQRTELQIASKQDLVNRLSTYLESHPELKIEKDYFKDMILKTSITGIFLTMINGSNEVNLLRMAIKEYNKTVNANEAIKIPGPKLKEFGTLIHKLFKDHTGFLEWDTTNVFIKTKVNWNKLLGHIKRHINSAYNYSTRVRYAMARVAEYIYNKYRNYLSYTPNYVVQELKGINRKQQIKEFSEEIKEEIQYDIPISNIRRVFHNF